MTRAVLLAGNPNCGKTTLFNGLTGSRGRTGNYPGVTVERRAAPLTLPGGERIELVDLPGTYSLTARSGEEQVAVDAILPPHGAPPAAVVVVADATTLSRQLYLALSVIETNLPVVLALNLMDEARSLGLTIATDELSTALGVEVIPVVARKQEGRTELLAAITRAIAQPAPASSAPRLELPRDAEAAVASVVAALRAEDATSRTDAWVRARAIWALLSIGEDELTGISASLRAAVAAAHAAVPKLDETIIAARYARIDPLVTAAVRGNATALRSGTERIDAWLTHPLWGALAFALVMAVLFQALFTWSEPLIGAIESVVALAQQLVHRAIPDGPLADLLANGIVAGVGNVVVFVPQIALLSLFLVVLEDSGYLARVAFVIDRLMRGVGLHGRAFVPLLSGFACAVPAVMATRTIESRRDRLVTMLALPLMSCSARLPVYALVTAVAFPPGARVLGVLSLGAVALFGMYALSVVATLGAAAVLRRTVLKGSTPALILELPPYRVPVARNVALAVWQRTGAFMKNAGTVILAISVILWGLLSFPRSAEIDARYDEELATLPASMGEDARAAALSDLAHRRSEDQLGVSLAGRLGRAFEPAIEPLGFDWKIGVGLIASFAAREVLVSTLGQVYGAGSDADETSSTLHARLRAARHPDGRLVFTPLTGLALMVFFVLAAQCMSTLAVVRREAGGWGWAIFMLVYMNTLAYVVTLLVYQGGRALGFA